MNRVFVSLIITIVAIAAFLVIQATQEGTSQVFIPSELAAQGHDQNMPRVRVGGRVADLPIQYDVEPRFRLAFSIIDPGTKSSTPIQVVYEGIKPDMFAPGRDVIIDGSYQSGTVTATKLLTQCPSKYEPPDPAHYGEKDTSKAQTQYKTDL